MVAAKGLKVEPLKRRYTVLLPLLVNVEEGTFAQGETFEHTFTPEDEWENVDSGLLGLVPDTYEVIGESSLEVNLVEAPASLTRRVVQPGDVFDAAIPLAREEQLRYHIRRVVKPPEPSEPLEPLAKPPAKPAAKKE